MDTYTPDDTISETKEESIAKAISLIQRGGLEDKSLIRPNVSAKKIFIKFILWIFIITLFLIVCLFAGKTFNIPKYVVHPIITLGCLLIVILKAKSMVRNSVLLYQKYAPEKMRRSCLFVPSCSEYMLLAVEKYGVVAGGCKGICRLCRCHHPNGGEDYP